MCILEQMDLDAQVITEPGYFSDTLRKFIMSVMYDTSALKCVRPNLFFFPAKSLLVSDLPTQSIIQKAFQHFL